MTLLEYYRLIGFNDDFKKLGSQYNLYEKIGNSVCIPMIKTVAESIKKKQIF